MVNRQLCESGPATSATAFLDDLYRLLDEALDQASGVLAGTSGMGGHVGTFTGPYDAAAGKVFQAGCDLAGAVAQLQLMVTATFDNYTRAEYAADMATGHIHRPARPAAAPYPFAAGPPSAVGDNGGEPLVWHLITALRPSAQWPDVATGAVRRAAGAWSTLAASCAQAPTHLHCATAELDTYRAPELPSACGVLERLGRQMASYADQCSSLATTLSKFADAADSAVAQLQHVCRQAELEAGAGATVAIVAGALSFGVGGLGAEGTVNTVLAGTVGMTIADLTTDFLATAAALCESFQVIEPVAEASTALASGILEARIVRASFGSADSAAAVGGELAETGAHQYRLTLATLERLEETTNTHVIERHVGRTLEQLEERFRGRRPVPYSSTFPDVDTALACINQTLRIDQGKIETWLPDKSRRVLPLDGEASEPIGMVMDPGRVVTFSKRYHVVLVRDSSLPEGFRVDSAYPLR